MAIRAQLARAFDSRSQPDRDSTRHATPADQISRHQPLASAAWWLLARKVHRLAPRDAGRQPGFAAAAPRTTAPPPQWAFTRMDFHAQACRSSAAAAGRVRFMRRSSCDPCSLVRQRSGSQQLDAPVLSGPQTVAACGPDIRAFERGATRRVP